MKLTELKTIPILRGLYKIATRSRLDYDTETWAARVNIGLSKKGPSRAANTEEKRKRHEKVKELLDKDLESFRDMVISKEGQTKEVKFSKLDPSNYDRYLEDLKKTLSREFESKFIHTSGLIWDGAVPEERGAAMNAIGGLRNMISWEIALLDIAIKKLKALNNFKSQEELKGKLRILVKNNIGLLTAFSKINIPVMSKLKNLLGWNAESNELRLKSNNFAFDSRTNPTRLLTYKSLVPKLVRACNRKGAYYIQSTDGEIEKVPIELDSRPIACVASRIETNDEDGKTINLIELTHRWFMQVMERTVFNNLDKWFNLRS